MNTKMQCKRKKKGFDGTEKITKTAWMIGDLENEADLILSKWFLVTICKY